MIALLAVGWAQQPATCPPDAEYVDGHAHLRALSLDLCGVVPEPSEYAELVAGEVPESLVEGWLDDPRFADQVVRRHRALLWNNVSNQSLLSVSSSLDLRDGIYYRRRLSNVTRGPSQNLHCGDFPATWENGELVTVSLPGGVVQEGWVEVNPYWDPSTTIKVCAFDAQDAEISPSGTRCDTRDGFQDPGCGCGPALSRCRIGPVAVDRTILEGFGADVDLRVRKMVEQDQSYLELLTGRTGFVNGPMVHYFESQTGVPRLLNFEASPYTPGSLPDLAFTDRDTFVEVPLPEGHAGVLTSPAYLVRFQTDRARANRFYTDFLCQPFQPPAGGIPDIDTANPSLDLSVRPGCQYCHALLEPAAAHWGRWNEFGGGFLDPHTFPAFSEECASCASSGTCSRACRDFYVTAPLAPEQEPYVGSLNAFSFLQDRHTPHVELGPSLLVAQTVGDGRLPRCVAKRTAEWLLGREMGPDDDDWVDALGQDFASGGFRYRELVKEIVTSDNYRRVR